MIIKWDKNSNPYDEIVSILEEKYHNRYASYIVQLKKKYDGASRYDVCTELLINNTDYLSIRSDYEWETDWWEGEPYVELIAAAPIDDSFQLPDEWRM